MSLVTVYSALALSAFSAFPSITCLQWTADGQLLYLSKNSVIVLVRSVGIGTDTSAAVKPCPAKGNAVTKPLAWLKTVVEQDKRALYHHWPTDSQEWGTVSLGSLDLSLRALASSPSIVSSGRGCVLAVITSNLQLSLWTAPKDHLKGQWTLLREATAFLKEINEAAESPVERTLRAQVGCCSWSSQVDFGLDPSPLYDGSILTLGSRAGTVVFLRMKDSADALAHLSTVKLSQHWITHVAWSSWSILSPNKCQATIACGAADGSVHLLSVVQTLNVIPGEIIGQKFLLEWETGSIQVVHEADQKTLTGLRWISIPEKPPILVHFKPGLAYVWSPSFSAKQQKGEYGFQLQTQKTSISASFLRPVSGVAYVEKHDMIVLSLYDGTFHTIYNLSTEPTLVPPSDTHPTSQSLSAMARAVFVRSEDRQVRKAEMCSISGMQTYDGGRTFIWVHEVTCPSDFSYKYDAQHTSTVVAAELWSENEDGTVVQEIEDVLARARAMSGHSPLSLLRPIFFKLLHTNQLGVVFERVLEILRVLAAEVPEPVCAPVHEHCDSLSGELRESLGRHLFGSQQLFALRLRFALADFCWKHAPDPKAQAECGVVAQTLLRLISRSTLLVLVAHLSAICDILSPEDLPFVFRVVVQCLLPDAPPTLSAAAQALSGRATERLRSDEASAGLPKDELEENCPACGLAIALSDMTSATCPNNHTWVRCSITSFILSTPMVRTCVGCKRKAFLPPAGYNDTVDGEDDGAAVEHLPSAARTRVVKELLRAVQKCLFCGNSFTSLL